MYSRGSREVYRRVSGEIKEQLTWISGRNLNPKRGVSSSSIGRSAILPGSKESTSVNISRGCNNRWCKEWKNSRREEVAMVRKMEGVGGLRRMSVSAGPSDGAEEKAEKKQGLAVVAGESLTAVETEYVNEDGKNNTDAQKETAEEPEQTLQDYSQAESGVHPDPNGEENPLVDEEVRRGLVADSALPYGHDREGR